VTDERAKDIAAAIVDRVRRLSTPSYAGLSPNAAGVKYADSAHMAVYGGMVRKLDPPEIAEFSAHVQSCIKARAEPALQ
jgi:hypothetical protein